MAGRKDWHCSTCWLFSGTNLIVFIQHLTSITPMKANARPQRQRQTAHRAGDTGLRAFPRSAAWIPSTPLGGRCGAGACARSLKVGACGLQTPPLHRAFQDQFPSNSTSEGAAGGTTAVQRRLRVLQFPIAKEPGLGWPPVRGPRLRVQSSELCWVGSPSHSLLL